MEFEFDDHKNQINEKKHGIGFFEAQRLWFDPDMLQIPAKLEDEPRTMVIGKIKDKLWTAIVTSRGHKIRIISIRRSREKEVKLYESS